MIIERKFKVVFFFFFVLLWFFPQEVLGESIEIKNQLSYVSKVIGAMESSIITIKGDVRLIKRQTGILAEKRGLSEKRIKSLEEKVERIEGLLSSIAVDVTRLNVSLESVKKGFGGLLRGSCSNARLCKRRK